MLFSARFQHHSSQYPRAGIFFLACTACRSRVLLESNQSLIQLFKKKSHRIQHCLWHLTASWHSSGTNCYCNLLNGSTLEFIMSGWARDPFLAPHVLLKASRIFKALIPDSIRSRDCLPVIIVIFNKQQIYANHFQILAHLHSTSLYIRTSSRMGNGMYDCHECSTYDAGNTFGVAVLGKSRACLQGCKSQPCTYQYRATQCNAVQ